MKFFLSRVGLRFAVVFVFIALQNIHCLEGLRTGEERASVGDDGVAEKHPIPLREGRSVKNNATPNLPDILGRMQAMEKNHSESVKVMEDRLQKLEERIEALLKPKASDSWFLAYFLGREGRNSGRGLMGPPGTPGIPGTPGTPGQVGQKGDSGKPGPKGDQGAEGRAGVRGGKGDKGHDGKSGVMYVRWGRTTCPSGADIVYKGIMGGEHYNHPGGGVNYLCLPHNPKYDRYKDGWQNSGYMYGTEYEVHDNIIFKKNLHDHEAPCAVCFAKLRGSMLMMPARNDCPSGWTEEYHGYLMTGYHNHKKGYDFICVDEDAEYVPGSQANRDGALLYPVQGQCGSLPCSPYIAGREFTCAVCTK